MRKIVFQQFISLDGYAADENKSTAFFESPAYAEESDEDLLREMDRFDAILLGANTYKMFAQYWPQVTNQEQIVASKLNSIPKLVFSNTLHEAPWGKWPAGSVISGDAVAALREIKAKDGWDMVLWGSITLAKHLINANLIDEYQLRIVPVLLGKGTLLFTETNKLDLDLISSKTYRSGLLLAKYKPK